jgi:hypothetical protein
MVFNADFRATDQCMRIGFRELGEPNLLSLRLAKPCKTVESLRQS